MFPDTLPSGDFSDLRKTDTTQVLEVLSPYTVKLANGDIIRLTGLNYTDYAGAEAGPFAITALKILKDMLEGEDIEVYQTPKKDTGRMNRMGHQLAHLMRRDDGAWAQGVILSLGLAQVQTTQSNAEMAAQMYMLEDAARKANLGIWPGDDAILTPDNAAEHVNSVRIVEGVIKSTAMNKNRTYLNFGGNWRDDFTISIAPENKRRFSKNGMNPLEWSGKRVRVRGWLEDYNGPHIEIDHPEALQFIE